MHDTGPTRYLLQLLLPLKDTSDNREQLVLTRRELVDRYGGVTAYTRSPAAGTWVGPDGSPEHDAVIMVEVVIDHFDRGWWRHYAAVLARRFGEQQIHLRAVPVLLP